MMSYTERYNTIQFRLLARLRKLGPQLTQPQLLPLHNTFEFGYIVNKMRSSLEQNVGNMLACLSDDEGARWSSGINASNGADRGSRPIYYLPCSDLGQVVNFSLSVA